MAQLPRARLALIVCLMLASIGGLVTGAAAQGEEIRLTITNVESETFPQVVVSVAASNENGPLEGLTPADFQILEDGTDVPTEAVSVENETLQDLRLVLAIDTSMPPADLDTIRVAADALAQSLGPRDRVAIITFAEDVSLAHDFTNNTDELQRVIDDLPLGQNSTALNRALVEGVNLTGQVDGHKAVIAITDSRDNTGTIGAENVITSARDAQTPLYVIGFGEKVASDPLQADIGSTGGQYFSLSGVDQVADTLQSVVARLRSGYRITFQSGLAADEAEHELTIDLTYEGGTAQAEGRFTARPGQVIVTISDFNEGQSVTGVVNLAPEITAPAPLASVDYQLDGQSLTEVTTSPFSFDWDTTTVEPGPHTLTIIVADTAGNQGETQLNLNVISPIRVEIINTPTEIELGNPVAIQANVEASQELVKVELLLDGELVASNSSPPYSLSFDSSQSTAGEHVITVRAEDSLGQVGTDEVTVRFVPPPPPEPSRWRRWLTSFRESRWSQYLIATVKWGAAALVILALALIGLLIIARIQRQGYQKAYQLALANEGNIRSRYGLRVEEQTGALKFQFAMNGVHLPQQWVTESTGRLSPSPGLVRPAALTPPYPPAPAPRPPDRSRSSAGVGQTVDTARRKQVEAKGCVTSIAGIFDTLGYLLPGSAGQSIRQVGQTLYSGQTQVDRAVRAPDRVMRTAGQLKGQVGQVTPSSSRAGGGRPTTGTGPMDTGTATYPVAQPQYQGPAASNGYQVVRSSWSQTPFIEPGQTLMVDLLIAPVKKARRTQLYSFRVLSKTVEPDNAPLIVEEAEVQISGISWLRRLVPYLIFLIVMTLVAVAIILLVLNLDMLRLYLSTNVASLGTVVNM